MDEVPLVNILPLIPDELVPPEVVPEPAQEYQPIPAFQQNPNETDESEPPNNDNMHSHTSKLNKISDNDDNEDDDGLTCSICLDTWEMSGEHTLVSLKCGHLFGNSCIRRWLEESARNGLKCCPQCKSPAINRDIRCLYARSVRTVDRSEEHQLREQLHLERVKGSQTETELSTLKMSYSMILEENQKLAADNERLKNSIRQCRSPINPDSNMGYFDEICRLRSYKLFLVKNIVVSKEPSCRVMIYSENVHHMIVSQKSWQNLIPGYGLRFIDALTFRPTAFLHTSARTVRDICLNSDQSLLVAASMEQRVKLFDTRLWEGVSVFIPTDKPLGACSFDKSLRENTLYLGAQQGSTYTYDIRFPDTVVDEFKDECDLSPVINIAPVAATMLFPNGGVLVCKLQSLWFYEYRCAAHEVIATRMSIEGPFISMSYDVVSENLLIFVRSRSEHIPSRYILGKLEKVNNKPVVKVRITFFGSKATTIMTRCSQIPVENNTLVASYIQDTKLLTLFDMQRQQTTSMPVQDVVYDTCAVNVPNSKYLAALTETMCRIYKLDSTD